MVVFQAKRLSAELKAVHVTMEGLLEDQSEQRALTEQVTQVVCLDHHLFPVTHLSS